MDYYCHGNTSRNVHVTATVTYARTHTYTHTHTHTHTHIHTYTHIHTHTHTHTYIASFPGFPLRTSGARIKRPTHPQGKAWERGYTYTHTYTHTHTHYYRKCTEYEEAETILNNLSRERSLPNVAFLTSDVHVLPDFCGNRSPLADPHIQGMVRCVCLPVCLSVCLSVCLCVYLMLLSNPNFELE